MASVATSTSSVDDLNITNPDRWAAEGYPWEELRTFRREAPVYWYDRPGMEPFWSFTRQQEIHFISRHPRQFSSEGRRLVIRPATAMRQDNYAPEARSIITCDPPDHGVHRNLVTRLFTPKAVLKNEQRIRALCDEIIDDVIEKQTNGATGEGHCDFVLDISARLPLYFTCELLGVPREDAPWMFHLTNITLGAEDPEYNKGKTPQEAAMQANAEREAYFSDLIEQRRREPKNDLTSLYLASTIGEKPMTQAHILAEMTLMMAGGFETTRNATSGGMLALIQHPDQYDLLLADPAGLMPGAVEEMLRWSSPIIQFGRDCLEDCEVGGVTVRKGETVCIWYASGNRDEDVFGEDSHEFRIQRSPNEHVAFGGFGEHYCLGANFARLFIRSMHGKLIERFERFDLDGEPQRLRSFFIGGIKHMPVRYKVRG